MRFWLPRIGFVLCTIALFTLCSSNAQYRDISTSDPYSNLIGRKCKVRSPLRSHGVTAVGSQYKATDYVTVWEPGFTGPEVTFVEYIPAGAVLSVQSARKCWNCPFDDLVDFAVSVDPLPEKFKAHPVFVRAEMLSPAYVECQS